LNDLVAIGEILIDFTPAGFDRAGAARFRQNTGGGPVNVACALARLGRSAAFVGKAGDDGFGRFCRDTLIGRKVDISGLVLSDRHNTTLAFVHLSPEGERSFSFYRKNTADVSLSACELDAALIGDARILHFGGVSLTDEPTRSATLAAVSMAKKAGALVTFDPNLRLNLWGSAAEARRVTLDAFAHADAVKLSDDEGEFFFGSGSHERAIRTVMERFGAKLVFVTCGARGAATVADGRLIACGAYDVKTVDTTGAGDCFMSGVLYNMLALGKPLEAVTYDEARRMLEFANAAGSLATTGMGALAAQPSLGAIARCMKRAKALPAP
jgi:sugar/nucleoside kinase (ribokinase family)